MLYIALVTFFYVKSISIILVAQFEIHESTLIHPVFFFLSSRTKPEAAVPDIICSVCSA